METNIFNCAIILAGGMGTRLASVVSDVPKPMAPVSGRPFLEYILDYWINQGINHFILSVGYKSDIIQNHFGSKYRNIPITYVVEIEPLGTGGALKNVLLQHSHLGSDVIVVNGDTWFEVLLTDLTKDYIESKKTITIAVKKIVCNNRYGTIIFNNNHQIIEFNNANDGESFINAGVYMLNVKLLLKLTSLFPKKFSLENDLLKLLVKKGIVYASVHNAPFLDIGLPDDYSIAKNVIIK